MMPLKPPAALSAVDPAFLALALFTIVGVVAMSWRRIGRLTRDLIDSHDRRQAIRLHFEDRWTHGQIAHEQGRDPAEVAKWLAEADRAGG